MTQAIQNYNFPDGVIGNTYDAITFNLPAEPFYSLAGAAIHLQLRKKPGQAIAIEYSTLNSKMAILTDYSFALSAQVIALEAGLWHYDILIVFASGHRATYIGGHWTILNVVTVKSIV